MYPGMGVPMSGPHVGSLPMIPSNPTPLYFALMLGLVFFMWSSALNGMMPGADKSEAWTALVLQAAFAVPMLTVGANLLGGIRGVSPLELTWVHLTAGILVFFILWNYNLANQLKPAEKRSSSSSSSSSASKTAEKPLSKEKQEKPKEPDPWENELAHPSAFLTTRKAEPKPWPFPMGLADSKDTLKLWWESGLPSHVGHFNRPLPAKEKKTPLKEPSAEKTKSEGKEQLKEPKSEDKLPTEVDSPIKLTAEQESEELKRRKQAEAAKLNQLENARIAAMTKDKEDYLQNERVSGTKRLWRMRILCIIVAISLIHKPTAFFGLLAFAMNIISDWLNPVPVPCVPPEVESAKRRSDRSASSVDPEPMSASREATSKREGKNSPEGRKESSRPDETSSIREEDPSRGRRTTGSADERKVRSDRTEPLTSSRAERTTRPESSSANAERSSSKSEVRASSTREESSRSTSESVSGSSRGVAEERSSSQSATKQSSAEKTSRSEVVTSEAIKKASGSTTVTKSNDPGDGDVNNVRIGFGMHYIHTLDGGNLVGDTNTIPSRGLAHPLMTTLHRGLAN